MGVGLTGLAGNLTGFYSNPMASMWGYTYPAMAGMYGGYAYGGLAAAAAAAAAMAASNVPHGADAGGITVQGMNGYQAMNGAWVGADYTGG